ncbi:MAG: Nif3-like dinuclear metal center hexameric protein [Brevinema sp.]
MGQLPKKKIMITRNELTSLLDTWLEPQKIKDHTVNGLQFEGKDLIQHIACAVDVSLETLNKAAELGVDFLITHHGLIWNGLSKITGFDKQRIQVLCDHQINLYCSHLPLDIHPTLGNNASLIKLLGAENTHQIFFDVGYYAHINIRYQELKHLIQTTISQDIVEMPFGKKEIKKIAICSGGAALDLRALFEAHQQGADTIISGETNSLYYHYAKELQMNILCAGHYATETFGVNNVNKEIKKTYAHLDQMVYTFIDFPTGF